MKSNYRQKLNSILRLRLFYSTEKELGDVVGLSLKKNHFNKQRSFVCEAFFAKFAEECRAYTQGEVDLDRLIAQYENTSKFFKQYIQHTKHQENKSFIPFLLNFVYLDELPNDDPQHHKCLLVVNKFDAYNKKNEMNIGILILLTYGLIPTFMNKSSQDVTDIIGDFNTCYQVLFNIAQSNISDASTKYKEMMCLKEMKDLISKEKPDEPYLNRLLLIHIANDVLNKVFALKRPEQLRQINNKLNPKKFDLPKLWCADEDPNNIVWEFVPLTNLNAYYLYRNVIDYQSRKIRFTKYQLVFYDLGYQNFCYTIIMRSSFNWYNMLKREQPDDSLSYDYTGFEYANDLHTVKQLTLTLNSSLREKPMVLKRITDQRLLNYYQEYLSHRGDAKDFEDEDTEPQYASIYCNINVATSNTAIILKYDDACYKLDKFDSDGNETISGITCLTHTYNFVYALLNEEGKEREFICLDSINQNLDLEELHSKPYFHRLEQVPDIF